MESDSSNFPPNTPEGPQSGSHVCSFILRNYYMVCIINVSPSVSSGEGVTLILISCL